jgi:hypothetical protein
MAIPLRDDFDAAALRGSARRTKDAAQARRLLALAAVYDGATRTEAARIGGVTLQIVRDWVLRFDAQGPDGLIDRKPPGRRSRLNGAHRAALAAAIESGPIPAVRAWRGALASGRPPPVALGGVPGLGGQADPEPGVARHGLPEAVRPPAPPRPGRGRH